jgi:hypothetical protein
MQGGQVDVIDKSRGNKPDPFAFFLVIKYGVGLMSKQTFRNGQLVTFTYGARSGAAHRTTSRCALVRPAAYATSLNSSLYFATPDTPAMACPSRTKTMKAASGTPSHWLARPCREAGSKPKRG